MPIRVLLAALAAAASLAACGSDPTNTSANQEAKNREAMLAFAQCMRRHGVNMPDPKFDGDSVTMRVGGKDTPRATMEAAQKACDKYQKQVKAPPMSAAEKAAMRKAALANAKCMRAHGIDFPDPTFGADGGAQVKIEKGSGIDPDSPRFGAAQKACEKLMPKVGG